MTLYFVLRPDLYSRTSSNVQNQLFGWLMTCPSVIPGPQRTCSRSKVILGWIGDIGTQET